MGICELVEPDHGHNEVRRQQIKGQLQDERDHVRHAYREHHEQGNGDVETEHRLGAGEPQRKGGKQPLL